ncbi:MAG TPA: hypothetical protein VGR26_12645, partial [Acidimicrobiales bacterium]|nr:hypothetical protein [Acidimicrobiales bacterium]
MVTLVTCLAAVAVSVAVVIRIVLGDDPAPARPLTRTSPELRTSAGRGRGGLGRSWWRREGRYFLEIFALCGFAVAQPVLASFGDSPETFVATDASARTIVAFGVSVVLLPALALWGLVAATAMLGARVRRVAQLTAVGLLVGSFVLW